MLQSLISIAQKGLAQKKHTIEAVALITLSELQKKLSKYTKDEYSISYHLLLATCVKLALPYDTFVHLQVYS